MTLFKKTQAKSLYPLYISKLNTKLASQVPTVFKGRMIRVKNCHFNNILLFFLLFIHALLIKLNTRELSRVIAPLR